MYNLEEEYQFSDIAHELGQTWHLNLPKTNFLNGLSCYNGGKNQFIVTSNN